ncbi:porin family protein [Sulfurovum sp. zt1-1]|uniref:Porin family protein n=1 Tax=Sulfurovum zhangzhouensis TaxID=3019067 RepID=A0ABT7QVW6_9BACT|nr:porin family protein [Sulfurovum zhangzhouensis]MDM5270971.1 porin family protein [Sulfurovum zhangzhouensis]
MKKMFLPFAMVAASNLVMAGGDLQEAVEPVVNVPAVVEEASDNNFYVGVGIAAVSARAADVTPNLFQATKEQDRLGNVDLLAGYEFHRHFAIEGRYTTSFTHDDYTKMRGWSLFAKPKYPVTEDFTVYGLLGYGNVELEESNGSGIEMDESSFQWGLGLSYMFNESFDFFADYKFLANDLDGVIYQGIPTNVSVDSFTVGVIYKF